MTLQSHPLAHLLFASMHIFAGHFASAALHRLRFGKSPLVLYRGHRSAHQSTTRLVSLLSLAWASSLALSALSAPFVDTPATRSLVALPWQLTWSISAAGLALMVAAQASMGASFRVGQDEAEPPSSLCRSGLHRLSRNPIYVGSTTFLAGMTLWHPSPLLLSLLVAIAWCIHRLVLAEEAFLRQRFGEAFEAYCRETPRYLLR